MIRNAPKPRYEWTEHLWDGERSCNVARIERERLQRRADLVAEILALDECHSKWISDTQTDIAKRWTKDQIAAAKRIALEEDDRKAREEIREEKRLLKLIGAFHSLASPREFSCLDDRAVETAADAAKVAAHASQSLGTRAAAEFICHIADRSKPFDLSNAMAQWDADQRHAYATWAAAPWYCVYLVRK